MALDFDFTDIEGFDWDEGNLEHIKKHNVTARECEGIFLNQPFILNEDKTHSTSEERLQVLGVTDNKRLIFLVFTIRDNKIRPVSARDQNKKERKEFIKGGEKV